MNDLVQVRESGTKVDGDEKMEEGERRYMFELGDQHTTKAG